MKTTGLFTTHRVEIDCELGKPFRLFVFGDVHRENVMHCHEYWEEFLERASADKNAVYLGMGDYTDGCSTSERIQLRNGGVIHDSTLDTMEHTYKGVVATLHKELKFMKGRVIGLIGGNHYFEFRNADTTDHVLASMLGTKFLGVCSFIRLSLRFPKTQKRLSYDILAHHGLGGGKLAGSAFNKVEDMQRIADADLYLMGHNHKKGCIPADPRLTIVPSSRKDPVVRERIPWLGRTGSFLKAYEPGEISYNVDAARPPAALGWLEFELTPTRNRKNGMDLIEIKVRGTS